MNTDALIILVFFVVVVFNVIILRTFFQMASTLNDLKVIVKNIHVLLHSDYKDNKKLNVNTCPSCSQQFLGNRPECPKCKHTMVYEQTQ